MDSYSLCMDCKDTALKLQLAGPQRLLPGCISWDSDCSRFTVSGSHTEAPVSVL